MSHTWPCCIKASCSLPTSGHKLYSLVSLPCLEALLHFAGPSSTHGTDIDLAASGLQSKAQGLMVQIHQHCPSIQIAAFDGFTTISAATDFLLMRGSARAQHAGGLPQQGQLHQDQSKLWQPPLPLSQSSNAPSQRHFLGHQVPAYSL